jgi:hypothetical protein
MGQAMRCTLPGSGIPHDTIINQTGSNWRLACVWPQLRHLPLPGRCPRSPAAADAENLLDLGATPWVFRRVTTVTSVTHERCTDTTLAQAGTRGARLAPPGTTLAPPDTSWPHLTPGWPHLTPH